LEPTLDTGTIIMIGHICIRDPDTNEILLRRRDNLPPPMPQEDRDAST
jgi:hypothetical protein